MAERGALRFMAPGQRIMAVPEGKDELRCQCEQREPC
jgi:hypothetical protein